MHEPKPRFLAPLGKPRDYVDRPELAVPREPECVGPAILDSYAESNAFKHSQQHQRNARLRRQGYGNYRVYLLSPHWAQIRRDYRESDLPQECFCGESDGVQLHHLTYERIGAERLLDLTPLCAPCHALVHVLEWRGELGIDLEGLTDAERAGIGRKWLAAEAERLKAEEVARFEALRAEILASSFPSRLLRALRTAQFRHVDVSHALHMLRLGQQSGQTAKQLTRKLRIIESKAYGWDDWR
jgi:hypothetical protein